MTTEHNKIVIFRMNGVGNAFLRELGCLSCPQCSAKKPRANTSGSLIIKDQQKPRQVEKHILFDFGAGVVDSLIDYGVHRVDYLFNSHNHLDHIAELDRLLNSIGRTQPNSSKPSLYATEATWKMGVARNSPWLVGMVNWCSAVVILEGIRPEIREGSTVETLPPTQTPPV